MACNPQVVTVASRSEVSKVADLFPACRRKSGGQEDSVLQIDLPHRERNTVEGASLAAPNRVTVYVYRP